MQHEGTFRGVRWGVSAADVRASETAQLVRESEDDLVYEGKMLTYPCAIYYSFSNGRFTRGMYYFNNADDGMDGVVYNELAEALTQKYGDGTANINWTDPLRRVNIRTVGELGNAAGAGYLIASTHWTLGDTSVLLVLGHDENEFDAHVCLMYSPTNKDLAGDSWAPEDLDLL